MRRLMVIMSLLALAAPVDALAKPPHGVPQTSLLAAPIHVFPNAHVAVTSVHGSLIRPGGVYTLRGDILNDGAAGAATRISVHLLRVGSAPIAIGRVPIRLRAHGLKSYAVRVRIPTLRNGSYAVVVCAARTCATAEHHLRVGAISSQRRVIAAAPSRSCSSGAHTLSTYGMHVYPETGNGGYTSVHSDVFIAYDAARNQFLPGTHVVLSQVATQCLSDFSLDFE